MYFATILKIRGKKYNPILLLKIISNQLSINVCIVKPGKLHIELYEV